MKRLEDKDPDGINVNYKFDFTNEFETSEIVSSIDSVFSDDAGLTVASSAITDSGKSITVYLTGGTPGVTATVTARFTNNSGLARTDDRSFKIRITDR